MAEASQALTPRISTGRSGLPTPWRISAMQRSGVKSSGVYPYCFKLWMRKPQRSCALIVRKVARRSGCSTKYSAAGRSATHRRRSARNRMLTPSESCATAVISVSKRNSASGCASAKRRSTGSRSSWAHRQFETGEAARLAGAMRPGTRRSISRPARLSVHTISPVRSGARPAARISSSIPIWRYSSIVRALMPRAFGRIAVPGWRSTSSERTPCCDNRIDAVRPTGPPPTIRTGTSRIAFRLGFRGDDLCQIAPGCATRGEIGGELRFMSDSAPTAGRAARPSAWTPLAIPIFRAVWLASLAPNIGIWLGNVGTAWLMTELRPTPVMVTLVQAATSLPVFLFALPAGAVGDVVDRRRLLILLQLASLAVALALAASTVLGLTTPPVILVASFLFGTLLAFAMPVFQAIVPDLVPRRELAPAVSLNSIGINVARVIGPALGGALILGSGVAAPFFINTIFYVAVVAVLLRWLPSS